MITSCDFSTSTRTRAMLGSMGSGASGAGGEAGGRGAGFVGGAPLASLATARDDARSSASTARSAKRLFERAGERAWGIVGDGVVVVRGAAREAREVLARP